MWSNANRYTLPALLGMFGLLALPRILHTALAQGVAMATAITLCILLAASVLWALFTAVIVEERKRGPRSAAISAAAAFVADTALPALVLNAALDSAWLPSWLVIAVVAAGALAVCLGIRARQRAKTDAAAKLQKS